MIADRVGNVLYRKGNSIYLQLVAEDRIRKIGELFDNQPFLYIERLSSKHLFRKFNAYGFNETILRTATRFEYVLLTIDGREQYLIPVEIILTNGKYLNFKEQGFEVQLFLTVDFLQNFRR